MLCLVIYLPSLSNGFIWDDDSYLYKNPWVQKTEGLKAIWLTHETPQYYPFVFTTFWLEHRLWGLNPSGYHTVNLILHILNALLVLCLVRKLCSSLAFPVALLFAIHPIQVETVAWISERKNLLGLLFVLLATLAYLRFDRTRRSRYYLLTFIMFVCALLSKSIAVCFAFIPLLYKWWEEGRLAWRETRLSIVFIATGLISALYTLYLELYLVGAQGKDFALTFLERFILSGRIICFYIYKILFPVNFLFFYPRWEVDTGTWWQWLFPFSVISALGILFIHRKRVGRGALALFVFYLISIFPALGFLNVYPMKFSFVADHFSYLSTPGLLLLICAGINLAFNSLKGRLTKLSSLTFRNLGAGLFILIIIYMCGKSIILTRNYKNEPTLWSNLIKNNPRAWLAYNNLAVVACAGFNKTEDAIGLYSQAIKINPNYTRAYYNRGNAYETRGDLAQAIADYNQAIKLSPNYANAYNNRGNVYQRQGNFSQALQDYDKAIEINPGLALTYYNRGNLYQKQGKLNLALQDYDKAIEINPRFAFAYYNRGFVYRTLGNLKQAVADYSRAIKFNPDYVDAYYNRGNAYETQGDLTQATADYNQAIKLSPNYANAYYNRGNVYQKQGNFNQALQDYNQAIAINPNYADAYNTRGNTYQKQGKLNLALQDYDKAIESNPRLALAYYNRGNLYQKQGKLNLALQDYDKVIEFNPDLAQAYNNRAVVHWLRKEQDKTKQDILKAEALGFKVNAEFLKEVNKK